MFCPVSTCLEHLAQFNVLYKIYSCKLALTNRRVLHTTRMSAVAILRVVDDECSVTMADSASFSIRLSGTPSFPAKKGRGSKPKATPPPPQQKRHVFTVTPALTLGELRFEAKALFGARSDCKVKLLSGFPPKALDAPDAMLAKDCLGKMENVIVCFETEQATGLGNSGAGSSTATTPAASGGRKRPRPAPSDAVDAPPPSAGSPPASCRRRGRHILIR